jgi:hypothetical protein
MATKSSGGFKPGFGLGGLPPTKNPTTTNPFTDGYNEQATKPPATLRPGLKVNPIGKGIK